MTKHWLDYLDHASTILPAEPTKPESEIPLLSLLVQSGGVGSFSINPKSKQYKLFVQGHAVLGAPLCPVPLYIELVAQAAMQVHEAPDLVPQVENIDILAPLGYDLTRTTILRPTTVNNHGSADSFIIQAMGFLTNLVKE